jgi:phosphoglycerate dehydrogenase-like enzyme
MNIVLLGRMGCVAPQLLRAHLQDQHEISVLPDVAAAPLLDGIFERAEVIVGGPLTPELARRAVRLKLFHAARAGLDGLGLEWLAPGVLVANTYNHEVSIAEYVMMAMLVLSRRPAEYDRRLRQGGWQGSCVWGEPPVLAVLQGATVLILGLGHIAREIIRRTAAFGMRAIGVSRFPRPHPGLVAVAGYDTWRAHLPEADFLVPCCPLNAGTRGLIGAAELRAMKPSARLINIARAEIVEEAALFEALSTGRIAAAALDVWYQYPGSQDDPCFPSRYPFHELSNVLLTPHVSGWTNQTVAGRMRDIAENINRLRRGEPLTNLVRPLP